MDILAERYGYSNYQSLRRPNVGTAEKDDRIVVLMLKESDVGVGYIDIQKGGGSPYVVRLNACYPLYKHELPKLNKDIRNRLSSLDGLALIEMEYIEGNVLQDYYYDPNGRSFEPEEMYDITTKILEGLNVIHSAGYYHSDVASFENIIITDNGPVIIDVEGGKIKRDNDVKHDNIDVATSLMQLIFGDLSFEMTDDGDNIMPPDKRFLPYFRKIRKQFSEYDQTLDIFEDIFINNIIA